MFERYQPDLDAYETRVRTEPCFICGIVSRDPDFPKHHVLYEDDAVIAFLNRHPTQYGYTLVAPNEHEEQVADDFTLEEYLGLQRVLHRVAEAVREEVGADRVYLLSLGSNEGNAHVHWHVVPLPLGSLRRAAVRRPHARDGGSAEDSRGREGVPRIGRRMKRSQETHFGG
jgi:diadenosine tetraphosphate (Ap4A) HIT family hydrolase